MTGQRDAMWIVPHTHWDREWYEPHDVFRARLVAMLDELLVVLERSPDYRFTLDGQTAALDDYLEIRPEQTERVKAAVARGQLAIGPFQILLDEFCCDGETIVRNLELGIASARRIGEELRVGYLPDMFGHAAQMPQFLRGFGIADAALWRGAPAAVREAAFVWRALNGDAVRVEYLWDGYGSALKLFEPLVRMPELVADYVRDHADWARGEPIAGMFGTDHMAPRSDLAEVIATHNASGEGVVLRMGTLGEVIESRDHSDDRLSRLPVVTGELRSHARGNLLPGVFSVRTGMKEAMAQAERALTTAERLDAWLGGADREAFVRRGWGLVVESTAHDSVTGCGVDATADQVESRLRVAAHTARGAIDTALGALSLHAGPDEVAVFNQSGWARPVQAELVVEGGRASVPTTAQVIDELPTVIGDELIPADDLPRLLRRIHGQELFGKQIRGWQWADELVFEVADRASGGFDLADFTAEVTRRAQLDPDRVWRVRTQVPPSVRVLVAADAPGLSAIAVGVGSRASSGPVTVDGRHVGNGLVSAVVRDDGLVDITDLTTGESVLGALDLVDEGDRGDSYNFGPVAQGAVQRPGEVGIEVLERGPVRGRVLVRRVYRVPTGLGEDRSVRSDATVALPVDTVIEVRVGEPFVRVSVRMRNVASDHRLRVLVPTGVAGVQSSASSGQYGVTTRGRTAEGGWGEFPLPTFPATRFVHAGRVGVLLDKLVEYEVVDHPDGDRIALTVLRAVGMMSVNVHPLRDEPAGSEFPVPGAQYLGRDVELRFAVDLSPDWPGSDIVEHADAFRFDPVVVRGVGGRPDRPEVTVETRGRVALESLRRVDDGVEARFVNYLPTPEPLATRLPGRWDRCDLTGAVLEAGVDVETLVVPGNTILTLRNRGER